MARFIEKLFHFSQQVFYPEIDLDLGRKQTAQLSSAFILVNWILAFALNFLNLIFSSADFQLKSGMGIGWIWILCITFVYPISRTKHYEKAALLYTLISVITLIGVYYLSPSQYNAFAVFGFLYVFAVYIVTIFRLASASALITGLSSIIIMIANNENLLLIATINSVAILFMVSILTLVLNRLRKTNFEKRLEIENQLIEQKLSLAFMQKTENINKLMLLGEVSSGIAHEIKNPLTAIAGKALVLKTRAKNGKLSQEDCESHSDQILKTVQLITGIITNVQRLAHSDSDAQLEMGSMENIVNTSIEMTREKLRQHQVQLKVNAKFYPEILCNETQLTQVIINLISNAVDAIKDRTEKWIELKIEVLDDKQQITVKITDSGDGIPRDIHQKIMTPFFTTKSKGEGTGMGLSFCRRIVEQHQGEFGIDLDSPNTCFYIQLPMNHDHKSDLKVS